MRKQPTDEDSASTTTKSLISKAFETLAKVLFLKLSFGLKVSWRLSSFLERWLWRREFDLLRVRRAFTDWWERIVPSRNHFIARCPFKRPIHKRECVPPAILVGALGSFYRCVSDALVRHPERIGSRLLDRAVCTGFSSMLRYYTIAGHPHHHPLSASSPRESVGSESQIGTIFKCVNLNYFSRFP